jgi:hypothetical protein
MGKSPKLEIKEMYTDRPSLSDMPEASIPPLDGVEKERIAQQNDCGAAAVTADPQMDSRMYRVGGRGRKKEAENKKLTKRLLWFDNTSTLSSRDKRTRIEQKRTDVNGAMRCGPIAIGCGRTAERRIRSFTRRRR